MRRLLTITICLICCAPALGRGEIMSKNVRVEKVSSFTANELWNSTRTSTVNSGDTSVLYRVIDSEVGASKSGWNKCALVMVGNGDLGIAPVAFRIWTKRQCNLEILAGSNFDSSSTNYLMKFDGGETMRLFVHTNFAVVIEREIIGRIVMPHRTKPICESPEASILKIDYVV